MIRFNFIISPTALTPNKSYASRFAWNKSSEVVGIEPRIFQSWANSADHLTATTVQKIKNLS